MRSEETKFCDGTKLVGTVKARAESNIIGRPYEKCDW